MWVVGLSQNLNLLPENFIVKILENYDDVLENKNIDVVYISLPIALQEKMDNEGSKGRKACTM